MIPARSSCHGALPDENQLLSHFTFSSNAVTV